MWGLVLSCWRRVLYFGHFSRTFQELLTGKCWCTIQHWRCFLFVTQHDAGEWRPKNEATICWPARYTHFTFVNSLSWKIHWADCPGFEATYLRFTQWWYTILKISMEFFRALLSRLPIFETEQKRRKKKYWYAVFCFNFMNRTMNAKFFQT